MSDLRRIERLDNGKWSVVSMLDLKDGDRFRMFEPDDGSPVVAGNGESVFQVQGDAYLNPDGIATVMVVDGS